MGEGHAHQETASMMSPYKLSELLDQGHWKLIWSWVEVAGAREYFSEYRMVELELYFESFVFVPLQLRLGGRPKDWVRLENIYQRGWRQNCLEGKF